jgi:hypothetical protein
MSYLSAIHQQLFRKAPSIFATEPYREMSSKYKFIPTIDVVDALAAQGFTPAKVYESRTRLADKRGFAKHLIRFRNSDILPQVGDLVPEIILTNSHDGSSAFQISAGLYRLVCSNGLTVGNDQMSVRQRHSGQIDDILEGVFNVVDDFPQVAATAREWQGIQLTSQQQIAFARAAMPLRWDADENENYPINPSHLLQPVRAADVKNDLWTTFNVVQERIIKGGVRARGSDGRRRRSKAVNSVNEDQRLNKALWTLAAEMAKAA